MYSLSKNEINKFANDEKLNIKFFREYDATIETLKSKNMPAFAIYFIAAYILKIISFGKLGGMSNSDFIIVLQS